MTERLRELERAAADGDLAAGIALALERRRRGLELLPATLWNADIARFFWTGTHRYHVEFVEEALHAGQLVYMRDDGLSFRPRLRREARR